MSNPDMNLVILLSMFLQMNHQNSEGTLLLVSLRGLDFPFPWM